MTVRSIMTTQVVTLHADETVAAAVELMLAKRFILLPVVDAQRCYLGEFDVWDLLRLLLPKAAMLDEDLLPDLRFIADDLPALQAKFAEHRDAPVGPLAQTNLPHLDPEMPVLEALLHFYRHRSTLPVI